MTRDSRNGFRFAARACSFWCIAAVAFVIAGCGGGEFEVAPTTGVLRCNGSPVGGGLVFFEPKQTGENAVVGKVGLGVVDAEGKFSVSTYGDGDGAIVGPHIIKVEKGSGPGCDCAMNADREVMQVEITSDGENFIEVDLPEKTRNDARAEAAEDDEDEEEDDQEVPDLDF